MADTVYTVGGAQVSERGDDDATCRVVMPSSC